MTMSYMVIRGGFLQHECSFVLKYRHMKAVTSLEIPNDGERRRTPGRRKGRRNHDAFITCLASGLSMLLHAQLETVTTSWLLWLLAPGAVGRRGTKSLRSL